MNYHKQFYEAATLLCQAAMSMKIIKKPMIEKYRECQRLIIPSCTINKQIPYQFTKQNKEYGVLGVGDGIRAITYLMNHQ